MRTPFLLLLLSLFFIVEIKAQTPPGMKTWDSRIFYTTAGAQLPNVSELNLLLRENGFPQLQELNIGMGSGFGIRRGALLYHLESQVFSSSSAVFTSPAGEDFRSKMKSTNWNLSIRVDVLNENERVNLYPMVGASYNRARIEVFSEVQEGQNFENFVSSPYNQLQFQQITWGGHVALQVEIIFGSFLQEEESWIIGLRPGYYQKILSSGWQNHHVPLNEGPAFNPGGLYSLLIVGLRL